MKAERRHIAVQKGRETVKCAAGTEGGRRWAVFILFALIVWSVYANTLTAAWQCDDLPNIVDNPAVHIETLDCRSIISTFFAYKQKFLRPVSYLSFGLNWYVGKNAVVGYHVVNILLHLSCSFLLYLVCTTLFRTPALSIFDNHADVFFISFFSAALWAVNPVQTQAVTYIVQRMAELAAFFYLLGLFFYLKGRLAVGRARVGWFVMVAGAFVCAVLSKENAIMLPVTLFLVELIFFSDTKAPATGHQGKRWYWWVLIIGLSCIIGLFVFANGNPLFFLNSYGHRPFTLMERVLTEPRIVLFYLSLLFYPLPGRLSVAHDVTISTGLFSPWTTSAAIGVIICLVVLSWKLRRRYPLFSFAVLFFFVNHMVESTVIPLELVFEHRNYLPSLFLFLPVVAGAKRLSDSYLDRNKILAGLILFCLPIVVVGYGRFTYERNFVWKSPDTLWLDALSKTRGDARPTASVAIQLGWGKKVTGKTADLAVRLFHVALQQNLHNVFLAADIYGNIGGVYYKAGNYEAAVQYYDKGLQVNPDFIKNRYDMIRPLIGLGRWDEALIQARQLVAHSKGRNPDYYNAYGFILLWQDQPAEALCWFQQALAIDPYNFPNILLNTGYALSRNGYYKRAEWFYKYWFYKGRKQYPPEIIPYFLLIENSVRAGNAEQSLVYARNLLATFDVVSVLKKLKAVDAQYETVPMKKALIAPVIKAAFYSLGEEASLKEIF